MNTTLSSTSSKRKGNRNSRLIAVAAMLALSVGQGAFGQTAPKGGSASTPSNPVISSPPQIGQLMEVTVGETRTLDSAWPIKKVSVADPAIGDVDAISPTRIVVRGKAMGVTEVALERENGEVWRSRLVVNADTSRLQEQLRKTFSNNSINVAQVDDVVIIKGTLSKIENVAQMRQLMQTAKLQYLDLTSVAGLQQVQLQVKIAEVSRTGIRYLSSDFAMTDGLATFAVNNAASGIYRPVDPFPTLGRTLPGGTSIFGTGMLGSTSFEYFVEALEDNQYLRILAEPTLVAKSGQEAQFLAGGEIPIPIAQVNGSENTQISIEYKEFGVRLKFTPTVLGDGRIELKVRPEVSQLSDVGSIVLLGTRIPSLLTRRVETTLELQSGQTFAIAGLIHQNDSARVAKIPGLGNLPVIGALFRSSRFSAEDTEMVVMVTASLAEASSNDLNPPAPGELHIDPNDWELYVEGRMDGKSTVRLAPAQRERMKRLGLDQLQGPGAWANYEGSKALAGENATEKK